MSYVAAIAGVLERLRAVEGLRHVQNGEPTSVQTWPLAYTLFGSTARQQQGQLIANKYHVLIILAVPHADNPGAEDQIAPFVNRIPAAFATGKKDTAGRPLASLGGRVQSAVIEDIRSGDAEGFRRIGDVTHRAITFELVVLDKASSTESDL